MSPLFSIITVTWNAAELLPGTIESVLDQHCADYEYLIIDGDSTDGTKELVRSYGPRIHHFLSEPDAGLYDAMNKGLQLATGRFVCFLNAGDHLHDASTLAHLKSLVTDRTDVLYGETQVVNDARQPLGLFSEIRPQNLPEQLHWRDMRYGMVVCHQAFFASRALAPAYQLDNLAADIDWIIQILKQSREVVNARATLIDFLAGGVSKQRHRESLWGRYRILRKHFGLIPNLFAHAWITVRAAWHTLR